MGSRWGRLVVAAALGAAPPAVAQRVTEVGLQATATFSEAVQPSSIAFTVKSSAGATVAGAVAYIVMPLDLVPDFIPFLGQVDDIYLLVLSLQRLISHAGLVVVVDHWAGDVRDLTPGRLRAVLLAASVFLPRGIRRRLRRR